MYDCHVLVIVQTIAPLLAFLFLFFHGLLSFSFFILSNLSLVLLVPRVYCLSLQDPPASIYSSLGCPRYRLHLQFSILASVLDASPGISGFTVSFPDMVTALPAISLLPSYPPFIPLIARPVYFYCHACPRPPRLHRWPVCDPY